MTKYLSKIFKLWPDAEVTVKAQFIRTQNAFVPSSDLAREFLNRVPVGDPVVLSSNLERSARQNALFHSMCALVAENSDKFQNGEEVKDSVKLVLGHSRKTVVVKNGEIHVRFIPKSITDLDGDDFNKFVDKAIDYFTEELGVPRDILIREVEYL